MHGDWPKMRILNEIFQGFFKTPNLDYQMSQIMVILMSKEQVMPCRSTIYFECVTYEMSAEVLLTRGQSGEQRVCQRWQKCRRLY